MNATVISDNNGRPALTMEGTAALPPVIVLNLFHSGLGIARQLAATGIRVVGLSANSRIYGSFTRLCEVRTAPDSQEQPDELARFLQSCARELDGAIIFPTRDADLLFLDRFRSDLEPQYRLAIPPTRVLCRVMDKAVLAETAIAAGIPNPRTMAVTNATKLKSAARDVGFPCVIKPVKSIHWREKNRWKAVGGQKAFLAKNQLELTCHYERISQVCPGVLLQEWIPGTTDSLVVWCGYVGPETEPVAYFTARKLVQSPSEFGTGCVVESEPLPDLLEPSMRLCHFLGYEGIAEIEYKRDPRDGTLKLIEMNARHWDWHELGRASQVNITWAAYCHLIGRPSEPVYTPVQRAKWVAEDIFVKHLLANLWSRGKDRPNIRNAIAGRRIYGMFSWNDPVPCIRYSSATLLPSLAGAVARKVRQRVFNRRVT